MKKYDDTLPVVFSVVALVTPSRSGVQTCQVVMIVDVVHDCNACGFVEYSISGKGYPCRLCCRLTNKISHLCGFTCRQTGKTRTRPSVYVTFRVRVMISFIPRTSIDYFCLVVLAFRYFWAFRCFRSLLRVFCWFLRAFWRVFAGVLLHQDICGKLRPFAAKTATKTQTTRKK